jgi:hypothetical protein
VPNDKLESLMAEMRAINLWNQLPDDVVLMNEIDRAGGVEARRIRRLEIIVEIGVISESGTKKCRTSESGNSFPVLGPSR